jgi:hypothetical protein
LDLFTSSLKGLAPASGGGTTNFLRADGTWAAPSGGGGTPFETMHFSRDFSTGNPSGNNNLYPVTNITGNYEVYCMTSSVDGTVVEGQVFLAKYQTNGAQTMIFDIYKRTKGTATFSPDGANSQPTSTTKVGEVSISVPTTSNQVRYSTSFSASVSMTGSFAKGDQLFVLVQSFFGFVSETVTVSLKLQ